MKKEIPLIKEYRIDILQGSLACFDRFIYDRNLQRDCVLKLYSPSGDKNLAHWDKSIFRGMVIPSLKHLGLIYGEGDSLEISTNAGLLVDSRTISQDLCQRVLRAVIYEIDKKIFQFIENLPRTTPRENFTKLISEQIEGKSAKQKKERIDKWLLILSETQLIYGGKILMANETNCFQAVDDLSISKKSIDLFKKELFSQYKRLSPENAGIVKIEKVRKMVCSSYLNANEILTESQFDDMFRKIPFEGKNYLFSFGKPMGRQERLFEYNGSFYNTIHIKFYN